MQRGFFVAAAIGLVCSAVCAAPLEGRWRLVEQSYGEGRTDLVPDDPPLVLEFTRQGAGIVGRIGRGLDRATARDWPAVITGEQVRTIHVEQRTVPPAGDSVRVRYRIDPAPGDDLTLHVVEEYRVDDDGRALVGTVVVSFRRQGQPKGSYTLHRRFEREP